MKKAALTSCFFFAVGPQIPIGVNRKFVTILRKDDRVFTTRFGSHLVWLVHGYALFARTSRLFIIVIF